MVSFLGKPGCLLSPFFRIRKVVRKWINGDILGRGGEGFRPGVDPFGVKVRVADTPFCSPAALAACLSLSCFAVEVLAWAVWPTYWRT